MEGDIEVEALAARLGRMIMRDWVSGSPWTPDRVDPGLICACLKEHAGDAVAIKSVDLSDASSDEDESLLISSKRCTCLWLEYMLRCRCSAVIERIKGRARASSASVCDCMAVQEVLKEPR